MNMKTLFPDMCKGIYLAFIRSLCIFVDMLYVYSFIFNIKYEHSVTLNTWLFF